MEQFSVQEINAPDGRLGNRSHTWQKPDALAEQLIRQSTRPAVGAADKAKDQVIAALRRRLVEMKQQLTAKDQELRSKQREIDLLYGKLAAASSLTDEDLRRMLDSALDRLTQQKTSQEKAIDC